MREITTRITKLIIIVAGLAGASFLTLTPISAQTTTDDTTEQTYTEGSMSGTTSDEYLKNIMINTYAILERVNQLPTDMKNISMMALAWLADDESDQTATLQGTFTSLGKTIMDNGTSVVNQQGQLVQDLFGTDVTKGNLPNANDLAYQTLLGRPLFPSDPRNKEGEANPKYTIDTSANTYLRTAAGFYFKHPLPFWSGPGSQYNKDQYAAFYGVVTAVQSYSAYILSGLYAEFQNGFKWTQLQQDLITQATSTDWYTAVSSEQIGIVLRQILLYQSQAFVMLTQMVQTQRQQLYLQAMTNSLLILNNQQNEQTLILKASGKAQ